jgi:DNA-3-methyladenine glycosylase
MVNFLKQKNTPAIARKLLGMRLVRDMGDYTKSAIITEVEAYDGFEDKASHASGGKTERNKIMFEEAGVWYVYLCYGVHWMLNVVTGPEAYPAAVLIRATDRVEGPGRLTKHFDVDDEFNGASVHGSGATLRLEDGGGFYDRSQIKAMTRIGVGYAGDWAKKPYRFLFDD